MTRAYRSTEKATQTAILNYLTLKRIFHFRLNSGAFKTERGGFYQMGVKGAPDIIAVSDGIFIGIECKDKGAKQNENQKDFQDRLEAAGGRYLIARSLDDVMDYL